MKKLHVRAWDNEPIGALCNHERRARVVAEEQEQPPRDRDGNSVLISPYAKPKYKLAKTGEEVPNERLCQMCRKLRENEWHYPYDPSDIDWPGSYMYR